MICKFAAPMHEVACRLESALRRDASPARNRSEMFCWLVTSIVKVEDRRVPAGIEESAGKRVLALSETGMGLLEEVFYPNKCRAQQVTGFHK